jgi:hypothetical protein
VSIAGCSDYLERPLNLVLIDDLASMEGLGHRDSHDIYFQIKVKQLRL